MMSSFDPRSWLQGLVGACVSVLIAAAAIYVAVRLIQAVAVVMLVILGVAGCIAVFVAWLLRHERGW
jgi:hypothetical protein